MSVALTVLTALSFLALLLASHAVAGRYFQLKRSYVESLTRLTGAAARHGHVPHALTAAALSRKLARRLHLWPRAADTVFLAALLHDVGELKVDRRLVGQVYRRVMLTDSDTHAYRQHPVLGEELLAPIAGMERVAATIRHHHEHWDGSGYPDGLRGEEIPLPARILAAVEAYLRSVERDPDLDPGERARRARSLSGTVAEPRIAQALAVVVMGQSPVSLPADVSAPGEGLTGDPADGPLRDAVRQSRLLENLGIGRIYRYRSGRFTDSAGEPSNPPMHRVVARLAARCLAEARTLREHVVTEPPEQVYDVYCFPLGEETAGVLLFAVTAVLAAEREELRRLQRAYSDVIAAVTRGRVRLLLPMEMPAVLAAGEPAGTVELDTLERSRSARELVARVLAARGFSGSPLFRAQVAVAEAVGNVFKHAGRGRLELRVLPGVFRAIISDQGPGIPLDVLPQAFLVDGFSTKTSLGKGYTLMLHYMDRLLITTGQRGTTLVLEKALPDGEGSHAGD